MAVRLTWFLLLLMALGERAAQADAHPFGIRPKMETVRASSAGDLNTWVLHPRDLGDFVKRVGQPSFTLLASGETDLVYYAVFRIEPDIFVFAYAYKKGQKTNGSFDFKGAGGSLKMLEEKHPLSVVDLLETQVEVVSTAPVSAPFFAGTLTTNHFQTYLLLGYAGKVHPDYSGPLILSFQLWNEGKDKVRPGGTVTVDWKANPSNSNRPSPTPAPAPPAH